MLNWEFPEGTTSLLEPGEFKKVFEYVDESSTAYTGLMLGCQENHVKVVKMLIKHGAEFDAVDKNGNTALIMAAVRGHACIIITSKVAGYS